MKDNLEGNIEKRVEYLYLIIPDFKKMILSQAMRILELSQFLIFGWLTL